MKADVMFRRKIRCLKIYREWRDGVLKDGGDECLFCEGFGNHLQAHHLVSLKDIIRSSGIKSIEEAKNCEMLWKISNGICLCSHCHCELHIKIKKTQESQLVSKNPGIFKFYDFGDMYVIPVFFNKLEVLNE